MTDTIPEETLTPAPVVPEAILAPSQPVDPPPERLNAYQVAPLIGVPAEALGDDQALILLLNAHLEAAYEKIDAFAPNAPPGARKEAVVRFVAGALQSGVAGGRSNRNNWRMSGAMAAVAPWRSLRIV